MSEMKSPKDVTRMRDLLEMESDNHPQEYGAWSILHNGDTVSLHAPHGGAWVTIPKDQFDAIVDWYTKPQHLQKVKA